MAVKKSVMLKVTDKMADILEGLDWHVKYRAHLCPKCGRGFTQDYKYCPTCGKKLPQDTTEDQWRDDLWSAYLAAKRVDQRDAKI